MAVLAEYYILFQYTYIQTYTNYKKFRNLPRVLQEYKCTYYLDQLN
jgi:hypothetical protein